MTLLSERMDPEPPPNVLVRYEVSDKLRNQVRHIAKIHLESVFEHHDKSELVHIICFGYDFQKGREPRGSYPFSYLDALLCKTKPMDFLDLVDFMCQTLYKSPYFRARSWNSFENELDEILRRNHMGYRVGEGELIPITDPVMAEEAIMPAFLILHRHGLDKARGELLAAFRHYGEATIPAR